jgi:hypothetical protein
MRTLSLVLRRPRLPAAGGPGGEPPVIRSTTQEVLLDAVVRDKKERLIRDLKPEEVRVLEDGVPQKLQTFRFTDTIPMSRGRQAHLLAAARRLAERSPALNPLHNLNIVTIVFERMGPRSRLFAQQAAAEFLANEFRSNTYGGVFSLDFRLNALQPYTNNRDLLRQAITRATTGNYTEFRKDSENVLNNLAVQISGSEAGITIGTAGGDPFQSAGAATQGAESAGMSSQGTDDPGPAGLETDGNGQLRSRLAFARRAAVAGPGAGRAAGPQDRSAASEGLTVPWQVDEPVPGHHRRGQPR